MRIKNLTCTGYWVADRVGLDQNLRDTFVGHPEVERSSWGFSNSGDSIVNEIGMSSGGSRKTPSGVDSVSFVEETEP